VVTYAAPRAVAAVSPMTRQSLRRLWPLALILILQSVVSLVSLRNTAFQDEALYLYAGRQILHHWNGGPVPLDDYASYFSGYPDLYPVMGGFLDMVGGLELARGFSLVCMLGVTGTVYWITARLFRRAAAIFASATYASAGVVLFVGRLATYDAMCLFLIALATAFAVAASRSRHPWFHLAIGPILALAILAKYAALLFVPPVFALLAFLSIAFIGWRPALVRLVLTLAGFSLSLAAAWATLNREALKGITSTTTNRAVELKSPRTELLIHVLKMGGAVYLIAFVGLLLILRLQWRSRVLAALLFGSSLLAPAYHIYKQESVSLDKHLAYGLFFAAPLAGYALAWVSGYGRQPIPSFYRGYWLAGIGAVMAVFALGLGQSRALYAGWANTSTLTYGLQTQLRDGAGRIMTEDIEVARYDGMSFTQPWQWESLYYPNYVDSKGQHLYGDPALASAVKNRYYNWVELSFNYIPGEAYFLAGQLAATRNYDLIAVIPFQNSYGAGNFYLWRSATEAGQGDFTSLAQLKADRPGSQP
jgi:4-amino-4-deoxy-L-arabinose transferase-like glycosyltransferase